MATPCPSRNLGSGGLGAFRNGADGVVGTTVGAILLGFDGQRDTQADVCLLCEPADDPVDDLRAYGGSTSGTWRPCGAVGPLAQGR